MSFARRLKPTHLRLLLKIAETGQLQRAASLVAMSQPAASRVLAEIEAQAGSPLFERHPKGMEPTALGAVCIRHATVILEEFDALEIETQRVSSGELGHVRVAAVTGPAVGSLMPAVTAVKAAAPDLEVTIDVGPSSEPVRGLVEGRFDFVIARLPPGYDSRDFRLHPARSEEVSLLLRRDHPLAGRRGVRLEELVGYDWVIQELGSPIRQAVDAAFHARAVPTPSRTTNSSSLLVVLTLLESTDVIAPQSREVAQLFARDRIGANLVTLDLEEPISVSPCFIIQNRQRRLSSAADRLLKAVFDHL
ncbi:MAG: LysR family transcriptional regulator [Pseudooceanicola sp.]